MKAEKNTGRTIIEDEDLLKEMRGMILGLFGDDKNGAFEIGITGVREVSKNQIALETDNGPFIIDIKHIDHPCSECKHSWNEHFDSLDGGPTKCSECGCISALAMFGMEK